MMKKLLLVVLFIALGTTLAYAENGAIAQSGKSFAEQQVFIECYNNSGTDISSNYVVILDTAAANAASGSTLGTYITTTTTPASPLVIGVTDQTIANGKAGRVCVRGPHKVYLTTAPSAAGATVATTTTAGAGIPWVATRPGNNQFGVALHAGVIGSWNIETGYTSTGGGLKEEGSSNYWIWVGGPCK